MEIGLIRKISDLYCGGAEFESESGNQLSCLRSSYAFSPSILVGSRTALRIQVTMDPSKSCPRKKSKVIPLTGHGGL
jgi:hypothetical protein